LKFFFLNIEDLIAISEILSPNLDSTNENFFSSPTHERTNPAITFFLRILYFLDKYAIDPIVSGTNKKRYVYLLFLNFFFDIIY
tara:strand:- start:397 stop:648 length:252 start_codon:yes stop_codon:yes gene_type:complete